MDKSKEIVFEEDEVFSDKEYKLVLTVVKSGFETDVIEAAKSVGSNGGILVQAKGIPRVQKMFMGFSLDPENTLVFILVKNELVVPVIKSIYSMVGYKSDAHGMVFALPVSLVAGMNEEVEEIKEDSKKHINWCAFYFDWLY